MTSYRSDDHLRLIDKGVRIVRGERARIAFSSLDDGCSCLAASLNAGTLSIIVGAGMSKPCGIPDWPTLVKTLLVEYLTRHYTAPDDDLLRYLGASPLIQIRILRRLYEIKSAFLTDLRHALYARITQPPTTFALEKLARLVVHTYKRGRPLRLITYNFDDLLENAITEVDPTVPIYPIFERTQAGADDGVRVFHPHGYLPRGNHGIEAYRVIFSEDEYHTLMSDNAHWANVVQLNAFQDSKCLFVGTSLTDPNVRRLLDRSRHNASQQHWIARLLPSSIADPGWVCHLLGEEMASLGISVVGLKTYDELPSLFERLICDLG